MTPRAAEQSRTFTSSSSPISESVVDEDNGLCRLDAGLLVELLELLLQFGDAEVSGDADLVNIGVSRSARLTVVMTFLS